MGRIIGRLVNIGLGKETTRGTSVAPTYWIPVTELEYDDKVNYIKNDSGMARIDEFNDAQINEEWAEGSYSGKIYDRSVGMELVGVFGQAPTSVQRTSTGVYDHTYALLNTNAHTALTVGYKEANDDLRYTMGMIDTWSMEAVHDNFVRRSVTIKSKKQASSSNTVSITDENEFIPKHITLKLASALAGLDAASATEIIGFNLEISKNVEPLYVMGSTEPDDIANKQFAISGSFELYYEDQTVRDYVLNNTTRAMRIEMLSTTIIGSSGTHTPALRFDLSKVSFQENARKLDNNEFATNTVNFEGYFSIADSNSITARLTNAVVSY